MNVNDKETCLYACLVLHNHVIMCIFPKSTDCSHVLSVWVSCFSLF